MGVRMRGPAGAGLMLSGAVVAAVLSGCTGGGDEASGPGRLCEASVAAIVLGGDSATSPADVGSVQPRELFGIPSDPPADCAFRNDTVTSLVYYDLDEATLTGIVDALREAVSAPGWSVDFVAPLPAPSPAEGETAPPEPVTDSASAQWEYATPDESGDDGDDADATAPPVEQGTGWLRYRSFLPAPVGVAGYLGFDEPVNVLRIDFSFTEATTP